MCQDDFIQVGYRDFYFIKQKKYILFIFQVPLPQVGKHFFRLHSTLKKYLHNLEGI
jgi:hypothetical protein